MNFYSCCRGFIIFKISFLMLCNNALADRPLINADRNAEGYWKTDRAKVLDNELMTAALVKVTSNTASKNTASNPQEVAGEITKLILAELSSENGVHVETALATLGASAGFSCQMAIREAFVKTGKVTLDKAFVVVGTKSGEIFYMGPLLNECLITNKEGQNSV